MGIATTETQALAVLLQLLPVAFIAFVIGGFVKGAIGLGMPVTVVSILCLATDIRTSAMLVLVPVLVTNLWQCINGGKWIKTYQRYWRLTLSMTVILLLTSVTSVVFSDKFITLVVGFVLMLFAASNLLLNTTRISSRVDPQAQYIAGIATGVLGGLSGLIVVPLAIYFAACHLGREQFITCTAPFFLLGAGLLSLGYTWNGVLTEELMFHSALLVIPAVIGLMAGEKIRPFIPDRKFRRLLLLIFLAMGVNLVQRGLAG